MSLSYSQLRRYRTCPRQYEFSHIKKIPWGISEGESFGASVHNALKRWGELEIGHRALGVGRRKQKNEGVREDQIRLFVEEEHPKPQELTAEKLMEIWHQTFVFDTYPSRFEADFARSRGEALMRRFFTWWSLRLRSGQAAPLVLAVEKGFSIEIDGVHITGRLDRVEQTAEGVRIIDYKTTPPCTQAEADADLQISLYALAAAQLFDKPCTELLLLFLSDEGVVERATARSASQLKDARTQITLIRERMEAKDFHPTPSVTACKRCPYRGVCDVAAV
ncbi:MAG: PD-(D/E)XK nuclease family protein [Candidatus Peribacteraceae bacterium]|nr:PD-(D/E)XK nuclease family protein [Candidatus Peribacteraceae bacterium]MDD5742728.1 PD-(D/E)XK nuclease family protein [Candidatus Peribacteraceae bacterium]